VFAEIRSIYAEHVPEKSAAEVEEILNKFKGKEVKLLAMAREKYGSQAKEEDETQPLTLVAELVVAAHKLKKELGEGPHWDPRRGTLLWLDVNNSRVYEYDPDTKTNLEHDLTGVTEKVTTIVPVSGTASDVIIGMPDGVGMFNLDDPSLQLTKHPDNGTVLSGKELHMNDGKCDPQGRLWIGTASPKPEGSLFVLDSWDGKIDEVLGGVAISNGLCWSDDGKTLYYADSLSKTKSIEAFDFNGKAGVAAVDRLSNRRAAATISTGYMFPDVERGCFTEPFPDGMAIDTDGMLWAACFGKGQVRRYNPQTGKALATIQLPVEAGCESTACAFGGQDLDELYITTACQTGLFDESKIPLAGGLFKVSRDELAKLGGTIRGAVMPHFCA